MIKSELVAGLVFITAWLNWQKGIELDPRQLLRDLEREFPMRSNTVQ